MCVCKAEFSHFLKRWTLIFSPYYFSQTHQPVYDILNISEWGLFFIEHFGIFKKLNPSYTCHQLDSPGNRWRCEQVARAVFLGAAPGRVREAGDSGTRSAADAAATEAPTYTRLPCKGHSGGCQDKPARHLRSSRVSLTIRCLCGAAPGSGGALRAPGSRCPSSGGLGGTRRSSSTTTNLRRGHTGYAFPPLLASRCFLTVKMTFSMQSPNPHCGSGVWSLKTPLRASVSGFRVLPASQQRTPIG